MITESQWKMLIKATRRGLNKRASCAVAQLSPARFYDKLKKDEEFRIKFENAVAENQEEHLKNIKTHSKKDWRASAWYLERTDPSNYALRAQIIDGRDSDDKPEQKKLSWFGLPLEQTLNNEETTDNLLPDKAELEEDNN